MSEFDRDPYEEAEKRGCIVVLPKPNELFVDIDNELDAAAFFVGAEILGREYWMSATSSPSPSGAPWHFHVRVTVHGVIEGPIEVAEAISFDAERRIMFQLILGSDRTREGLSLLRVLHNEDNETVFFEKDPYFENWEDE